MTSAKKSPVDPHYDFIVVGAGTAGCTLANRLTASGRHSVLMIEAGGLDNWIWFRVPVGYLYAINNPRADWCYRTEAEAGLNGRSLIYPRGKVVGGCSSINGMIYMRGQAADYDNWAALGNPGWSWNEVLPYFIKSEDRSGAPDALHGKGGEWHVENMRHRWKVLELFRDAAAEHGIPPVDDFNRGDNEGMGYFEVNQRRGVRLSTAGAFLRPALRRPNFTLWTKAQASRLMCENGRVVALELVHNGERKTIRSKREVILAAGAVNTPQLLQLSGIGDGSFLQQMGIPVTHHLPGVGENLQDHLQLRTIFSVENLATLNSSANSLWGKAHMALLYVLFRRGPMTMAPSQMGGFTRSSPNQKTPNLQFHVQPLSLNKFGEPLHKYPAFTATACNLRPESRGHVRIKSADPLQAPAIQPNYLSADADRKIAVDAIRLLRRIVLQSKALAPHKPSELKPGPEVSSEADLLRAAGDIGTTIFHPVGTCRMGLGKMAVVDSELKLRGVTGLRVVDASIMPTITSGNTNSPTIMIAEKAAVLILKAAS